MESRTFKETNDLIFYRLNEIATLLQNMRTDFNEYKKDTDRRLNALDLSIATQSTAKLDWQKILLAVFGLISTVVAGAFALVQSNLIK